MAKLAARRIHDVTILASNVAMLRTFCGATGFGEFFAKGDDLVVFAAGANELAIHSSPTTPRAAVALSFAADDTAQLIERHR